MNRELNNYRFAHNILYDPIISDKCILYKLIMIVKYKEVLYSIMIIKEVLYSIMIGKHKEVLYSILIVKEVL